ncbi:hypothetical protein TRAPUB_6847 [Trametes pubescens]|uniref:Uncharacterized protein n=1 Tax=Trametes pubescens TaxID=154538 RepID=A0A1M2V4W5_TRAPU|nr:hypothetical protein TRAPUB_6847 [Trametes pubescens]
MLAAAKPDLVKILRHPSGVSVTDDGGSNATAASPSLVLPSGDLISPSYDADKHSKMSFFSKKDFKRYQPKQPLADLAYNDEGVPIYLEQLDGSVMSADLYNDLRTLLKQVYETLETYDIAPSSWKHISGVAFQYTASQVYAKFPCLGECASHWKLHNLCTRMYPDHKRNRAEDKDDDKPAKKTGKGKGAASSTKRPRAIDSPSTSEPPTKHARTQAHDTGALVLANNVRLEQETSLVTVPHTPSGGTGDSHNAWQAPLTSPFPETSTPPPPSVSPMRLNTGSTDDTLTLDVSKLSTALAPSTSHIATPGDAGPSSQPETASRPSAPLAEPAPSCAMSLADQLAAEVRNQRVHAPSESVLPVPVPAPEPIPAAPAPFVIGNPLDKFKSSTAPPLPSLLDNIKLPPSKSEAVSKPAGAIENNKKVSKLRVTKNKTAR